MNADEKYFHRGFFGGFRSSVFSVCTSRLNMRLKGRLFQSYLKQEIGFFDTNESGKLISRLNHDTQVMSSVVTNNITQFITAFFRFGKYIGFFDCVSLFVFDFSWNIYYDD